MARAQGLGGMLTLRFSAGAFPSGAFPWDETTPVETPLGKDQGASKVGT